MISNRPYLLRAFYQWIVDSSCTPILVLDANHPKCKIPKDFAEGGEIVFNISASAVRDLKMTNESIEFKASFSGVIHIISAPTKAVLAVYAEENGEGIFFDAEEDTGSDTVEQPTVKLQSIETITDGDTAVEAIITPEQVKGKPVLRLVE